MIIRKQSTDEHTVVGYADFCACAMPRAMCGCSIQACAACGCDFPETGNAKASVTQHRYDTLNSGIRVQTSNLAQSKMIH